MGEYFFMSGQVIRFHSHLALRRAGLYRQKAGPRPKVRLGLEEQLSRIESLLLELESLTQTARDVPSPVLVRVRQTMERAQQLLKPGLLATQEGEPQPVVDGELLERHYRELDR
jgi:hypothetical protein